MDINADDLLLYRIIHDWRDIDQVSDWVDENHLTLNAAKSKVMVISRRRVHSTPEVCLSLNSQPLENYKYLGILFELIPYYWSTHIHNIHMCLY